MQYGDRDREHHREAKQQQQFHGDQLDEAKLIVTHVESVAMVDAHRQRAAVDLCWVCVAELREMVGEMVRMQRQQLCQRKTSY